MNIAAASQIAGQASMAPAPARPYVLFEDGRADAGLYLFKEPTDIIVAHRQDEVAPALARMQSATNNRQYLAGYAAYELGHALEPKLARLASGSSRTPLLRFGVFGTPQIIADLPTAVAPIELAMRPAWSAADYAQRFAAAREYILAGDIYQLNLTFPLHGRYDGDPLALYRALRLRQPVAFGGLVALGDETIISLSPEVFFETQGQEIRVRPMKGTAKRGYLPFEDMARAQYLNEDIKNRAENLMIVDLLRNDLSRLSEIGSVKVTDLFTVETYPTLHQMTSGVEARLRPGVTIAQLFAGLFPCGSITGAPKIRAMEIIRQLEDTPRGVYCGSLGVIAPNGDVRFNVAIRTLTLYADQSLVCNVGSAIVADSQAQEEYAECLIKAKFLTGESAL